MKIAQLTASYTPVTKKQNKAIYSHVAWLTDGLCDLGHEVHLFANKESNTDAQLHTIDFSSGADSVPIEQLRYKQWAIISDCYKMAQEGKLDIIHSHFNIMSSFFADLAPGVPTLISIHSPIEEWMKPVLMKYKHLNYISFTRAQRKQMPELNWVANIYHGVDTELFTYNDTPGNSALFLGRITAEKGPHDAIAACKEAGIPLRIAGASYDTESYWQKEIQPHIDGRTIQYIGEADFDRKIALLQNAKVLIFPTHYHEAFGYVMIEAMACGTPVIAFNNGSVPEIVKDGKTGFIVNSVEEMTEALKKIDTISRDDVRRRAELFFSEKQMVSGYEAVYKRIIEKSKK
jgi:glycosyltransferase involved in cell wall biosynthesis